MPLISPGLHLAFVEVLGELLELALAEPAEERYALEFVGDGHGWRP
jgi:hypothetical protein